MTTSDTTSAKSLARSRNMQTLLQKRELKLQSLVERWTLKLRKYQNARLVTALLLIGSLLPFTVKVDAQVELTIASCFLVVFLVLVYLTRQINHHVQGLRRLLNFIGRQKRRAQGQASGQNWKQALEVSQEFPLIRDLGLVGSHSLWTLLDETLTDGGQRRLLHWMSVSPLDKNILRERQNKIQKLRSQTWFYTRLGLDTNAEELNLATLQIQDFLKTPFTAPGFSKLFALNMVVWLLTFAAALYSIFSGDSLPVFVFLPFPLLSLFSLGSVGSAFKQGVGLSLHMSSLVPIFHSLEKQATTHKELQSLCTSILKESPSKAARKLEFALGFLGTQTNPLLHFLLNVIVPWTMVSVFFSERLRRKISHGFPLCIDELSEIEVFGSLLILDRYQTQTYPEFADKPTLNCRQIYHPLLDRSRAVANDFGFPESKSLGLLTGSNMSGKSTFLRTVGVNQVLANMGAPVFADQFVTIPLKIETCIEVSDSLRDGYSYFYSEVRRLRDILQTAATGAPVLFLIDEIFRGTNNRERQIGSKAVIRTLAKERTSLGFISTHDLELTSLEETNPSLINLHFREDIDESGKMVFSYHLRHGPCPTTNALRIMAAEGINIEGL
ncbi:DNA mismatch repair protein MutS [compost metagenome]